MQIEGFNCPDQSLRKDAAQLTRSWNYLAGALEESHGIDLVPSSVLISSFTYCIIVKNRSKQTNRMVANLIRRHFSDSHDVFVWDEVPGFPQSIGLEFERKEQGNITVSSLRARIDMSQYKLPLILGENSFGKPMIIDLSDIMFLSFMGVTPVSRVISFFPCLVNWQKNEEGRYGNLT